MDGLERRRRAARVLAGYDTGPGATDRARDVALARARGARMVVLVEGISDLMALDAVAQRRGLDLESAGIVVAPVGGAQAFGPHLDQLRAREVKVRSLVDAAEAEVLRRSVPAPSDGQSLESLGVFVCVEDLEDELIKAVGTSRVEAVLEREGDLGSFRTLQRQPAWRQGDLTAQLRRFLGAGARRKLRYARLLALELDPGMVPRPLRGVLEV